MKSLRKKGILLAALLCFTAGTAVPAFGTGTDAGSQSGAVVGSVIIEHLSDLAGEIVNNMTEMGLEDIHKETGDAVSGTLVSLLGGATGRALGEIEEEIEKTQDMIMELQANLDAFAASTNESLAEIKQELYEQNLKTFTDRLDLCYQQLDELNRLYSNIISNLYQPDGTLKDSLTEDDWRRINAFIAKMAAADDGPTDILNEINSITSSSSSDPLYTVQMECLTSSTSMRHKTYMNLYDMVNYVTQLRSTALTFLKEEIVYAQMKEHAESKNYQSIEDCYNQQGFEDFIPDYDTYFRVYYNPTITATSDELAKNDVFSDMAEVFQSAENIPDLPDEKQYATEEEWNKAVTEYMSDYIAALKTAIDDSILTELEVYDPDGNRVTEDAYQVVSNKDGKTYYISLAEHTLSEYVHHSSWERWNGLYNIDCDEYSIDYGSGISSDGRYLLPTTAADIENLMSDTAANQLSYLIGELKDSNDECQLPSDRKIILTTKTESEDWDNTKFWDNLYLLDSGNYSTSDSSPYIEITDYGENDPRLVNAEDIYFPVSYQFAGDNVWTDFRDARLLMIYTEQGIKKLTPNTNGDLPAGFNLEGGDTLDLSRLEEGTLERKITVTGDVTIYGGGKSFEGLQIYLCEGAHLTLEDITITSESNIIKAYGRNVSLTANGKVSLTTTTTKIPIHGYSQCEQLSIYTEENASGEEEFNVTGTALKEDGGAAIYTNHKLMIDGAKINIHSSVNRAISCGKSSVISGAILNCDTKVEDNVEITMGSGSTIENSTLNLTWGGISGDVTMKDNTWTGKVRVRIEIKTGSIDNAGTDDKVDMTLHSGNASVQCANISSIDGDQFEKGHTDTFYYSLEPELIKNDAMTLEMQGDDGWFVEYAKVYNSSDPDAVSCYYFYRWLDNDGQWKAYLGEVASTLIVTTADENLAGTASNIDVAVKYIDKAGQEQTTDAVNITKFISNGQFDAGDTDTITLVYPELREDNVTEILGYYVTSDHSGSNAGWKLASMDFYLTENRDNCAKMLATGLDQWFLEKNQKCYFGKTWAESGSCTITTKTANTSNAGTDSDIYLTIHKVDGTDTNAINFTEYCQKRDYDPMEKGKTDKFNIAFNEAIGGGISTITLKSDGNGSGPTWECEYIEITYRGNDGSSETFRFSINKKIGKGTYEFAPDGLHMVSLTPKDHYSVDELKAYLEAAKESLHAKVTSSGILSRQILSYLKATGKSLTLEHQDENGNVLYQWIFRGEDMKDVSSDIDLRITFVTEGLEALYGVDPAKPAVALQFHHTGAFPEGTSIRFNGETFGFKAEADAYPYSFDSAASKLTLQEEGLLVNSDGTISLWLSDSSDILVTGAKLADEAGVDNTSDNTSGVENTSGAGNNENASDNGNDQASVATGDEIPAFLWISLLICILLACVVILLLRKYRKQ